MYEDSSREMKCTLNPAVAQMSGKCGSLLFKTYTKADGTKQTRAYFMPKKGYDKSTGKIIYGYSRKSKPTKKETVARERFAKASEVFKNMTQDEKMRYNKEWKAAKFKFNGKEYNTLRGYIIARLFAEKVV